MRSKITPAKVAKAMASPRAAVLVRTDLDLAQAATWDPTLPRDARLLVPIDLQALAVAPGAHYKIVATETILPAAGAAAEPGPPVPFGAFTERAVGVHLNWAMPDGLTRGDAGAVRATGVAAGNPMGLPPLPDRWIVTRLVHGTATAKSWIIEADRGDHHDLSGWTEPGPLPAGTTTGASGRRVIPRDQLTAVAGGDLSWAATYDAVVNRFAFHDDLADLDPAHQMDLQLSYVVAGWWSDPTLDPLQDCTSAGAYHDRLRWLGWLAPDPDELADTTADRSAERVMRRSANISSPPISKTGRPATPTTFGLAEDSDLLSINSSLIDSRSPLTPAAVPAMPRQTLLHGSIFGITMTADADRAPRANSIEVAIGPTGFAALSAMLAEGTDEQRVSSERVVAAFASGLLSIIDTPGGLAAVDEDRHASGFRGIATGTRSIPDRIAEGDVMTAAGGGSAAAGSNTKAGSAGTPSSADARLRAKLVEKGKEQIKGDSRKKRGNMPTTTKTPRTFRDVPVPTPRSFVPSDLAFVLRGASRSPRHGSDGRFTASGLLACRLPSQVVDGLRGMIIGAQLPGELQSVASGSVPPEVDLILREAVLTDPYRWTELVTWITAASGLPVAQVTNRVKAEVALRNITDASSSQSLALDDRSADVLRRASLQDGYDQSPVGITRWAQPWIPLWCDWELALEVDDQLNDWTLGAIDLQRTSAPASTPAATTIQGRSLLASSTARALSAQINQWLSDEDARDLAGQGQVTEEVEADLAAAASAAADLDVLTGTFRGVRETLLGLDPYEASMRWIAPDGTPTSKPRPNALPLLLTGARATVTQMRIVDAFGRYLDLPTSRLKSIEIATTLQDSAGAPSLLLAPRFQRPSRVAFRFVDPRSQDGAPDIEARIDQQNPDQAVSPLAGWLLPDHVDEALEFFDASGSSLGQLMHDELTGAVVWEGAPGQSTPMGAPPDPGSDLGARHVTRLAAGAVLSDAVARNDTSKKQHESALSALLRAIDTTLWTIDPLGSVGTGAVAGLVGRPIAVVRAILRLDIDSDVDSLDFADAAARAARIQAYTDLAMRALSVRLGELTRTDDTLLAYAINDDYSRLSVVAPEVLEQARESGRRRGQLSVFGRGSQTTPAVQPIDHPYVAGPHAVAIRPAQTVHLTLLMHPGGKVHLTSGVLPRKSLALAKDWFHDALVRLSPSFRVGPVLVDPTTVRLPSVSGLGDHQIFTHRDTPLTWRDDPMVAATQTAYLPEQPSMMQEGWIRVEQAGDEGATGADNP